MNAPADFPLFPALLALVVLFTVTLLAGCAPGDSIENDFYARHGSYRAFAGTTDEPSCGGTGAEYYFEGDRLRKISYSVETSQRMIDIGYYFRDGRLALVTEISHSLLDDQANRLSVPRFEYSRSYRMDRPGEIPAGKKSGYETHAAYLIDYYARHKSAFTPANPLR